MVILKVFLSLNTYFSFYFQWQFTVDSRHSWKRLSRVSCTSTPYVSVIKRHSSSVHPSQRGHLCHCKYTFKLANTIQEKIYSKLYMFFVVFLLQAAELPVTLLSMCALIREITRWRRLHNIAAWLSHPLRLVFTSA